MKRAVVLSCLISLVLSATALAGPTSPMLLTSDPEADSALATAPSDVTLTFSQALDEHYSRVEVYACGKKRVSASGATVTANEISVALTKSFRGRYTVFYFANGVPKGATGETAGTFTFKVKKGKACP